MSNDGTILMVEDNRHGGQLYGEGEVGEGVAFHFTLNARSSCR
jgi:hypothetical protein